MSHEKIKIFDITGTLSAGRPGFHGEEPLGSL